KRGPSTSTFHQDPALRSPQARLLRPRILLAQPAFSLGLTRCSTGSDIPCIQHFPSLSSRRYPDLATAWLPFLGWAFSIRPHSPPSLRIWLRLRWSPVAFCPPR